MGLPSSRTVNLILKPTVTKSETAYNCYETYSMNCMKYWKVNAIPTMDK